MGIIAAAVKTFTGDEYASPAIINFRRAQCNTCQFKNGKWCGKPIVGNFVIHNNKTIKLCGCITNEKTELKNQTCPANRW